MPRFRPTSRDTADPRVALAEQAEAAEVNLADLSALIRRDRTYLPRYVRHGVPAALAPDDHQRLADFFGVDARQLGVRDLWARRAA